MKIKNITSFHKDIKYLKLITNHILSLPLTKKRLKEETQFI